MKIHSKIGLIACKGFKNVVMLTTMVLVGLGCNHKAPNYRLDPASEVYATAKQLAAKYPFLDPDNNLAILECRSFNVTVGDVFAEIDLFFPQLFEIVESEEKPETVRNIFYKEAERIAKRRLAANAAIDNHISLGEARIDSVITVFLAMKRGDNKVGYLDKNGKPGVLFTQIMKEGELVKAYYRLMLKDKITVSESGIRASYDAAEYLNLQQIFLSTMGLDKEQIVKKQNLMKKIKSMLDEGFSFTELAKTYSEDKNTSVYGGRMKGVRKGQFPSHIENVIFNMQDGECSDILEGPKGLSLFFMEQHVRDTRPYDSVRGLYRLQVEEAKRKGFQVDILNSLWKKGNCHASKEWQSLEIDS